MNVILSILTLSAVTIGSIHAATPAQSRHAETACYTADIIANKQYQDDKRRELGRPNRGGTQGPLIDLAYIYVEDLVDLLVPVARNLSREEALIFWSEVEPLVIRKISSRTGGTGVNHARALINYQKLCYS